MIKTPTNPADRLALAADLASDTLAAQHRAWMEQIGVAPVLVVATPDSDVGRQFLNVTFGPLASHVMHVLTGPTVLAFREEQFLSMLPATSADSMRKSLADAQPSDMRIAFAVNASRVDLRIEPAAAPDAASPSPHASP